MRIILLGDNKMLPEMSGVELVSFRETRSAITALEEEKFDIAIVDSLFKGATLLADYLSRLCIPVILLLRENCMDWVMLDSMNALGYIYPGTDKDELQARLKAVMRRAARSARTEVEL